MKRLPPFSDMSPGIMGDLRKCLRVVQDYSGDFEAIVKAWNGLYFGGKDNKRSRTNVTSTLVKTDLMTREPAQLTALGTQVLSAPSAQEAAAVFCKHIIENHNGLFVIDAIRNLNARHETVSKDNLKAELKRLGITDLAVATTDHTTLRNWMVAAGLLDEADNYKVQDAPLKKLLGVSATELDAISESQPSQRIFLVLLRKRQEVEGTKPLPLKELTDECLRDYPGHFDDDQLRKKVIEPLEAAGWITASGLTGGRGSKSGLVQASSRLMGVPTKYFLPDFSVTVPADLQRKINTPLVDIKSMLNSSSKHQRGLGLELLSLRVILDLGLEPRAFRLRSRDTGFAEVDLTAEGKNLLFSRWAFQCKCVTGKVGLSDVAKEVGIAVFTKSHVIAMVATSDFTKDAYDYAREVTYSTHLQFLFLDKKIVMAYLSKGRSVLLDYVLQNAAQIMADKRDQPLKPSDEEAPPVAS